MKTKINRIGAVVLTIFLIGSMIALPISGALSIKTKQNTILEKIVKRNIDEDGPDVDPQTQNADEKAILDSYRRYDGPEYVSLAADHNDMGYNVDVSDTITRSLYLYVGEVVDNAPGRTRTGYLDPNEGDTGDWYRFAVCEGQTIQVSFSGGPSGSQADLFDFSGSPISNGYTAPQTDWFFVHVHTSGSGGKQQYNLDVTLTGQNDAGKGSDAGDTISQASSISAGSYEGYMDMNDPEDWYSFNVNSGQGIFVTVDPFDEKIGDFDIHLYNPSGEMVHREMYYGEDELKYPADQSGNWKIKIDMFPGWDTSKWPDDYFLYGSGPYTLDLSIGGSAQSPPDPIPQPDIYPVAQTFKIPNKPNSNEDEYDFLAAVPAAVYKQGGKQYVSPVVYTGDNSLTSWFGTAEDTTNYLLDDWDAYLSRWGFTANEVIIDDTPINAAANLATSRWTLSDNAVLAMDGSQLTDYLSSVIDKDATLKMQTSKTVVSPGDQKIQDFAGFNTVQMLIGQKWGAMTIYAKGSNCPGLGLITTRYELGAFEDWPHPYDTPGDNTNIYIPIGIPGLYWPYLDSQTGFDTFEITKYSCDRYKVPINDEDTSIEVTVTTDQASYLEVFLVDPTGSIRRPNVPSWNGGPIKPIHQWNGDHHNGFEEWRRWEPTYSKTHTASIHYPSEGKWTVIVVPHYPYGQEKTSDNIDYHIKVDLRQHNTQRVDAGLSAANAAVIASQMNAPLLYVTEDSVPSETQNALNSLGVKNTVFVNINGVSKAKPKGTYTELRSIEEVVSKTKAVKTANAVPSVDTGNIITITSFGSEDGFFAPAGLIAAYHGSNVLNIGEIPDAYNFLDKATVWREYTGGWYHGCRSQGHLPKMDTPVPSLLQLVKNFLSGNYPDLGIDQHYRWWTEVHDGIYNWVKNKGLTGTGQEVYLFVAPRDTDIRHPVTRVMSGLGSYAGQFPFDTPGMDASLISRDILYSAIIYANPGRDITTAQLMNFPDGWTWKTNDGVTHTVYSTRDMKATMFSHGRFFEGHVIYDNWLERMNDGVSINYYSGHGTGGSGVSAQYKNVAEAFPDAELRHDELHDFDWWDSWRGYMYDDTQTKSARWGGFTWYNAAEPNLYDIIHFKWIDQQLQNLHSEIELWMSCTTGQNFGPEIYLEHGSALWYGNAGTGLCPQEDLLDDSWIKEMMVNGATIGEAFSKYAWYHQRDFTAKNVDQSKYNMALYGTSSMDITNVQVIYGDPTLICYSPEWTEPQPTQ